MEYKFFHACNIPIFWVNKESLTVALLSLSMLWESMKRSKQRQFSQGSFTYLAFDAVLIG